jgi:hypothetical protein
LKNETKNVSVGASRPPAISGVTKLQEWRGEPFQKKFFTLVPLMLFSKIFQEFEQKHKGGPRQFFRVFKKISKINLIPCF